MSNKNKNAKSIKYSKKGKGGGCKPWAISSSNRTVSGDNLIISYSYLRSQKNLF